MDRSTAFLATGYLVQTLSARGYIYFFSWNSVSVGTEIWLGNAHTVTMCATVDAEARHHLPML